LDNARPITTQRYYKKKGDISKNRWTDKEAEEFEKMVSSEIDEIIKEWNTGKYDKIELPMGGLFDSSISRISKGRVPKLYAILETQLNRLLQAVGQEKIAESAKEASKKKSKKPKAETKWTYMTEEYQ